LKSSGAYTTRQQKPAGTRHRKQYRSAIYYHNPEQKKKAEASIAEEQKKHDKKIVTEVIQATAFYPAEEYHQHYHKKTGTPGSFRGLMQKKR